MMMTLMDGATENIKYIKKCCGILDKNKFIKIKVKYI